MLKIKRQPKQRVFDITINGLTCYRENAGSRIALEVQHDLAEQHGFVRVVEKFIGGARATRRFEDDESGTP